MVGRGVRGYNNSVIISMFVYIYIYNLLEFHEDEVYLLGKKMPLPHPNFSVQTCLNLNSQILIRVGHSCAWYWSTNILGFWGEIKISRSGSKKNKTAWLMQHCCLTKMMPLVGFPVKKKRIQKYPTLVTNPPKQQITTFQKRHRLTQ